MKVEQALDFALDGWAVIPLRIDKKPWLPKGEQEKYLYRAASEDEIKSFWQKYPDANVGLACGKVSGRTVIDIDDGEDVFPETRTIQTPSGGRHKIYLYSPNIENSVGSYYKGIDTRNDGGYIVAEGAHCEYEKKSTKITGNYVAVEDTPARPFPEILFTDKRHKSEGFDPKKLDGAPEGERNNAAASVIGLLVSGKSRDIQAPLWELAKAWNSRSKVPLEELELLTVFNSITKREWSKPQTSAKLIDGLKITKEIRDYVVEIPLPSAKVTVKFAEIIRSRQSFESVITVQLTHEKEGRMPAFEQRLDMNSASAVSNLCTALNAAYGNKKDGYNWVLILNRAGNAIKKNLLDEKRALQFGANDQYEKSIYLVEHFLEKGSSTLVHGDGSTGKSYLCLYMAVCAALRRDFMGKRTDYFKTLYLDFEATSAKLKNRMHRVANGLDVPFALLSESIHWYKPEGSLANEQEIIARMVEDGDYGCIIVDAGASASGGSPMDEQAVLKMFNAIDHIPCAKLIIHHEPKNVEGLGDDKAYYGTTFWRNAPRLAWRLKRESKEDNKSIIKAIHHKANDDSESAPVMYAMTFSTRESITPAVSFAVVDDFEKSDESKIVDFLNQGEADMLSIATAIVKPRMTTEDNVNRLMERGKVERKRAGKKYVYFVQNNF